MSFDGCNVVYIINKNTKLVNSAEKSYFRLECYKNYKKKVTIGSHRQVTLKLL